MDFKGNKVIEIRAATDNWGLYTFDFLDSIPTGSSITGVVVTAYEDRITPSDAEETDLGALEFPNKTSIDLIDSDYAPTISGTVVRIKLKYPGDDHKGKATIVFMLEIDGSGEYPFFFTRVVIK